MLNMFKSGLKLIGKGMTVEETQQSRQSPTASYITLSTDNKSHLDTVKKLSGSAYLKAYIVLLLGFF